MDFRQISCSAWARRGCSHEFFAIHARSESTKCTADEAVTLATSRRCCSPPIFITFYFFHLTQNVCVPRAHLINEKLAQAVAVESQLGAAERVWIVFFETYTNRNVLLLFFFIKLHRLSNVFSKFNLSPFSRARLLTLIIKLLRIPT